MFEEDSRCYICQEPIRSSDLFCSAQCKAQDVGKPGAALKTVPVHLTSQLPPSLSPHFRPQATIQPSPRMPPHGRPSSSSSSSDTGSPRLQSPATNPAGAESPQKEPLDLGPPAFPTSHLAFSGSIPVKIPSLVPRPNPAPPPAPSHGTVYGTSIDTLRFGRKPALINSVTSPNALIARCACGKPANHPLRATSRERGAESDFSRLSLGPSVLQREKRLPSDPSVHSQAIDRRSVSGHGTPQFDPVSGSPGASALSRSRSDSMHPKMYTRAPEAESSITPPRRASTAGSRQPSQGAGDRGRSRERTRHAVEAIGGVLNHPPDREVAPSRSRHRRDENERERERSRRRERQSPLLPPVDPAPITPSWNRGVGVDDGIAPSPLRGGWRSPRKA